jgi:hypothetical protein
MEFLNKVIKRTGANIAIVLYNAGWHVAHDLKDSHWNRKVTPILIAPRVPQLNAIGLYFTILKKEFGELKFTKIVHKKSLTSTD